MDAGEQHYFVSPHVEYTQVEDGFVLMDLKAGTYLGLDPVASLIWESLSDHGSAERAADDVCRRFEVDRERALADVESWIVDLLERGLLTRQRQAPTESP